MYAKNEVYRSKIKEKALFGWSLPLNDKRVIRFLLRIVCTNLG